jgi:hypothetical protein
VVPPDEGLAAAADEIGAAFIRGTVRYRGELGEIELGGLDNREYLHELRDQEVKVIGAPLDPVEALRIICGLRRAAYHGDVEPTSRAERE